MILSDKQIRAARRAGDIVIEPWDDAALGTNSYDVHLGGVLLTYAPSTRPVGFDSWTDENGIAQTAPVILDCKHENPVRRHLIGPEGFVLRPGTVYLGSTVEYTETHKHVPFLDGKSSVGRLGSFIHCTAGRGDVGFCNHWTLEIVVAQPVRVYAGMPIGQLIYFETGDVAVPYNKKPGAKYNERCAEPQPSRMWRNFVKATKTTVAEEDPADCPECDGTGHQDGCDAREPAYSLDDLYFRSPCNDGCCPNGHKPHGLQAAQDEAGRRYRGMLGR